MKQLFVISAPSGAGKTTIARHLLTKFPFMAFSVSATTRSQRPNEENGRDYYFLSRDDFERRIAHGDLVEHEEIFGNLYGTLISEIEKSLGVGKLLVFDVDVKGALSLKRAFPDEALLIFIAPPSFEKLEQRLESRNTESQEQLKLRLSRAEMEISMQSEFDAVIINDNLERAFAEAEALVLEQSEK